MSLVSVQNLRVAFSHYGNRIEAVRGVSFSLKPGESLGIVGESGSGKSVSCNTLLRLLPTTAQVTADRLFVDGIDVLRAGKADIARLRGRVAAMIFQDPMTAFDPVFTVGNQIAETIMAHRKVSRAQALTEALALLQKVEIRNPGEVLRLYPHQLSGGMLQRAMIAMALSCRPKLLIADEPTTALDVITQATILRLIKDLQAEFGMALVMVTHDLGVIAETVDKVLVMYRGEVMEDGAVEQIFDAPAHPYTRQLLASLEAPPARAPQMADTVAALELIGLTKTYKRRTGLFARPAPVTVVERLDLVLPRRQTLALVGESGSGKTTTGMMALRLTEPTSGRILLEGDDITTLDAKAMVAQRRKLQVVFQDSYSALDPMMTLGEIIAEPLHIHGIGNPRTQHAEIESWLCRVGLDASYANRYPHELSGGQRQRVAIARALILRPSVLVADEPTSALDVTVKRQIIELLAQLRDEMGLSLLLISHDLHTVRSVADQVAVMHRGRVVEEAPTQTLFEHPRHPYTRSLLAAQPARHPRDRRKQGSAAPFGPSFPRPGGSRHLC